MLSWIRSLFSGRRTAPPRNRRRTLPPRSPWHGRALPGLEELGPRIVPVVGTTTWTDTDGNYLWSDANNWNNGLPTASKVVIFDGSVPGGDDLCKLDPNVADANRVVAGIQTQGGYSGTLSLVAGKSLTVSSLAGDATGFRWQYGSIKQGSTADVLIITGGGTAANNKWSGGTINSGDGTTQSNLYINGGTTLQVTAGASALGDNIIIGEDLDGGSTLEFYNQTTTLQVTNNAYIQISDNSSDATPANQLLFDTDLVNQGGTVSKGLATTSTDSFIDNYGVITRSNPGKYQIDLPIKNEAGQYDSGTLDLKSDLWISGRSANKTQNNSVDQEGGQTILENGSTLQASYGYLMNAGQLYTYGSATAMIYLFLPGRRDLATMTVIRRHYPGFRRQSRGVRDT